MPIVRDDDKLKNVLIVKEHVAAEHKARVALARWWHAWHYSLGGLQAAWYEKAFKLEVSVAIVMLLS
jgi:hypothetical protein